MATQIIITDAGRAARRRRQRRHERPPVEIGLANAPFVADKLTKLPNELKRIKSFGGANVAPDTIHTTLKDDTADQYSLYGFGLYLENGVLLASYGQATPIMEKSPAAMLLLSSDLQFATIDATKLVFGDASPQSAGDYRAAGRGRAGDAGGSERRCGRCACSDAENRGVEICGVDRAKFTGPVVTEFDAGPDTAHVTASADRQERAGKPCTPAWHVRRRQRRYRTRLIATVRAGFDNGAWGASTSIQGQQDRQRRRDRREPGARRAGRVWRPRAGGRRHE